MLYLIEILHQTTTIKPDYLNYRGCILSKFYIKPQLIILSCVFSLVVSYRNSTSNHNCGILRGQPVRVVSYRNSTSNHNESEPLNAQRHVVSYRNSTSNHNNVFDTRSVTRLYLIEILHQTTTIPIIYTIPAPLYLIEILHQTTTACTPQNRSLGCILSKFYIKPQLSELSSESVNGCILSKFYIKPQQNTTSFASLIVVSYRNSTSNHNFLLQISVETLVVSYRNSTSNHNKMPSWLWMFTLYLIEILHQTTTKENAEYERARLYLIEILHQTTTIPLSR